jgi:hypothetical protein
MNLEEYISAFHLTFYSTWNKAQNIHKGPVDLIGPPQYAGVPTFSSLKFDRDWGFVGNIVFVEELLSVMDKNTFTGTIGHEVGHIKRDIDEGYRTAHPFSKILFLINSFRPYFDERNIELIVKTCVETPEDYYAEVNLLNAGFIEEAFAHVKHTYLNYIPFLRNVTFDRRMFEVESRILKICPFLFLGRAWYHLSTYPRMLAGDYAYIEHESVPDNFKSEIRRMWKEHEDSFGLNVSYSNAIRRIREDFLSHPQEYMNVERLPKLLLHQFKLFTQEYIGIKELPKWEEQREMINRTRTEIEDLVKERDKILSELYSENRD